ncbi:MAG: hypothetical protein J7L53_12890 [Deltaproteobacteria bacterium]|nr:hypothetical protein [Deltaproteobacteria bacterium]
MKDFKRLFSLTLALLVLFALAACSSSDSDNWGIISSSQESPEDTSGPEDDQNNDIPEREFIADCDKGWLEKQAGHYILHLEGSAYEMGYQHGILLKDQVQENINNVPAELLSEMGLDEETKAIINEVAPVLLGIVGEIMEPYIPDELRQELKGVCDGAGVPYIKAVGLHTFLDSTEYISAIVENTKDILDKYPKKTLLKDIPGIKERLSDVPQKLRTLLMGLDCNTLKALGALSPKACTIFGAWGNATDTHKTIFARGLDFPWMPTLVKNSVLTFYKPDKGIPFASLGWAGYIGGLSGMNIAGLTFGETTCSSKSATLLGEPFFFLCRDVLQFSETIDEAIDRIKNTPRTSGYTIMVMDPVREGVVIEESGGIYWGKLLSDNINGPIFTRYTNTAPAELDAKYEKYGITPVKDTLVTCNCAITEFQQISWSINSRYARVMQQFNKNEGNSGYAFSVDLAKAMLWDRYGLDGDYDGDGHVFKRDGSPITHGTLQDSVYVADDLDIWIDPDHSVAHEGGIWLQFNLNEEFGLGSVDRDDSDGDGIPNDQEQVYSTNKNLRDTDGDGLTDGEEIGLGFDPTNPDTNGDGNSDWKEYINWPELNSEIIDTYNGVFGYASLEKYDADYGDLYIAHLKGRPYEMGYQLGYLLGENIKENYNMFVQYLMDEVGVSEDLAPTFQTLIEHASDLIALNMRPFTPSRYYEEAKGIEDGAKSRNIDIDYMMIIRMVAISNAAEIYIPEFEVSWREPQRQGPFIIPIDPFQCSFFAAWGDRTEQGRLLATRNLDWAEDTGIAKNRLITLYQPDDGIPYVTLGWAGFIGAIAGMNAQGICVSEIGSHNQIQSIWGTPWALRLREVLREGKGLISARNAFERYPNTQGFNFMIADGDPDGWQDGHYLPGAWAIETDYLYTAFFGPNDKDEDQAIYNGECYALRLDNAVFRADSAMDQRIRKTQAASNGPDGDPRQSGAYKNRYKGQYDRLKYYEDMGIPLTHVEAIEISKGVAMGCNVLSVVYAPTVGDFYVGYEKGGRAGDGEWHPTQDSRYERFNIYELIESP